MRRVHARTSTLFRVRMRSACREEREVRRERTSNTNCYPISRDDSAISDDWFPVRTKFVAIVAGPPKAHTLITTGVTERRRRSGMSVLTPGSSSTVSAWSSRCVHGSTRALRRARVQSRGGCPVPSSLVTPRAYSSDDEGVEYHDYWKADKEHRSSWTTKESTQAAKGVDYLVELGVISKGEIRNLEAAVSPPSLTQ